LKPIYAAYDWQARPAGDRYIFCPLCTTRLVIEEICGRSRKVCPQCGFIHFLNPAPAIGLLIVKDGKVLLGERLNQPGVGKWALPSGYIDFEEDYLSAAKREALEETGLQLNLRSIVLVESAFLSPEWHYLTVYLFAEPEAGTLQAGDDLKSVGWFPVTGPLPEMAFEPDVNLILDYASGRLPELAFHP